MIGGRLRAQVSANDAGYSTLVWNTISSAAPKKRRRAKAQKEQKDLEKQTEAEIDELPEGDIEAPFKADSE
jgi:hypothetical protein